MLSGTDIFVAYSDTVLNRVFDPFHGMREFGVGLPSKFALQIVDKPLEIAEWLQQTQQRPIQRYRRRPHTIPPYTHNNVPLHQYCLAGLCNAPQLYLLIGSWNRTTRCLFPPDGFSDVLRGTIMNSTVSVFIPWSHSYNLSLASCRQWYNSTGAVKHG